MGVATSAPLTVFFAAFCVIFCFVIYKIISTWHKNNKSPRLTVPAVVRSRREDTRYHTVGTGVNQTHHSETSYLVTFEFESTDTLELSVGYGEYKSLHEGDCGYLSFQGTRFMGFEKKTDF